MIKIELTQEEYNKLLQCVAISINHCENELKDCEKLNLKNPNPELEEIMLNWKNRINDKRPLLDKLLKLRIKE